MNLLKKIVISYESLSYTLEGGFCACFYILVMADLGTFE